MATFEIEREAPIVPGEVLVSPRLERYDPLVLPEGIVQRKAGMVRCPFCQTEYKVIAIVDDVMHHIVQVGYIPQTDDKEPCSHLKGVAFLEILPYLIFSP